MKQTIVILTALIILAAGIYTIDSANSDIVHVAEVSDLRTVILDAGHGGEDGGAVAPDGTLEKELNLLIAEKISSYFDVFGIDHINVRDTDISVCDEGLETVRKRKYSDIMNRAKLVDSVDGSVLLSIHQNMFSEPQYSGTQVFYTKNTEDSSVLAEAIQKSVVNALQPANDRQIKPAGSEIYLLDKAKTTSVLVECGFLSNPEELEKLKDEHYEAQLSYFIFRGLLGFLTNAKDV